MNEQLKRNRILIIGIFSLSIIPVLIAWGLYLNRDLLNSSTNLGKLVSPPIPTDRADLEGIDEFSNKNINELLGRWVIINFISRDQCAKTCKEAIHKTRQLRLMLNKDLIRTRRIVIISSDSNPDSFKTIWENDDRLIRVKARQQFLNKLSKIEISPLTEEGTVLLMDPLGNLMMQYEPGFNPYHVVKDLKKLLKVSQIG